MSGRDHSPSCLLYSLVPSGGKTYSSTFLRVSGVSLQDGYYQGYVAAVK
jgi:hypothetical protein